ncbi:MAG: O-antigen ligase family protein [Amphiplicatus sp.]
MRRRPIGRLLAAEEHNWRERLMVRGAVATALLIPLAAVFAHRAYAPILLGMGVVAGLGRAPWRRLVQGVAAPITLKRPATAMILAVAGFVLWIALSLIWSPAPAAERFAGVALAVLATSLVAADLLARRARDIRFIAWTYISAAVLGTALLFFEAESGGYLRLITPPPDPTYGRYDDIAELGRGLTALLPGVFPALAMIVLFAGRRRRWARWMLLALAAALPCALFRATFSFTIASNSVAIVAAAGCGLIAYLFPRRAVAALLAAYLVALVGAPLLAVLPADAIAARAGEILPLSWAQRLFIWRETGLAALHCLPFGCGADYARAAFASGIPSETGPPLTPLHPHNVFLQLWLELGLVGVALIAIALIAGGAMLRRAHPGRIVTAGAVGAGAAVFVLAFVEMSVWQEWRLASIGMAVIGGAIAYRLEKDAA